MAHLGPHLYSIADKTGDLVEPATDVFEIEDFTSPSPLEKFISEIEHLIREWGLNKRKPLKKGPDGQPVDRSKWPWRFRTTVVSFHGFEFRITEHTRRSPNKDNLDNDDDSSDEEQEQSRSARGRTPDSVHDLLGQGCREFPPGGRVHPVHYYYGLNEFVVMAPNAPREREEVDNETRAKTALSAITVALHNTDCTVPFFLQVMELSREMFTGVSVVGGNFRTNYDMIVLGRRPPYCDHLTGLLSLFKSKILQDSSSDIEIPPVRVTVRFSHILEDWTSYVWSQPPPDLEMFDGSVFGPESSSDFVNELSSLPFGTIKDPVKQLRLHATWYDLNEDIITDNDVHSDLDLVDAPAWSVGVLFEEKPQCLLSDDYLLRFNAICDQDASLKQLLGEDMFQDDLEKKIPGVFNRLTGNDPPELSLTGLIGAGAARLTQRQSASGGPIKPEHLNIILDYLFPDSQDDPKYPYPKDLSSNTQLPFANRLGISITTVKSCPIDGIVWRLGIVFAHCLHVLGGLRPLAHLMHEFMMEVRYRHETGHPLPGLPPGSPDHGFCLFHQKLQMVNCCIEKKILRERGSSAPTSPTAAKMDSDIEPTDEEEEDEDEFYDCDDGDKTEIPVWSKEPVGRFKRLGRMKLLQQDEYLYVPHCQDPTPMTEDMLAEQAEVMLQLGMDAEGAHLRAKMQSASLLSDMESFKAANPGAVLADFVRWHSPRDWDNENKKMSPRMTSEGNVWQESWENAKPVPARRQKRLFDDTREAEKVLEYLTSLKTGEVAHLLMPVLLHASIGRILDEGPALDDIPHISDILGDALQKLSAAARLRCLAEVKHFKSLDSDVDEDADNLSAEVVRRTTLINDVIKVINMAELKVSQAFSLRTKFLSNVHKVEATTENQDKEAVGLQMREFVKQLFVKPEVQALGASRGPVGQLITRMFKDAYRASHMIMDDEDCDLTRPFPKPVAREFVLKTKAARPYTYSKAGPQRLYCRLKQHEFRVAGAFTIHKTFL